MRVTVDIEAADMGSIVLLTPLTEEGRNWIGDNCQAESWQWLGNGLCVDHRYADAILEGAEADGLAIA